jgi:hypothetical protein
MMNLVTAARLQPLPGASIPDCSGAQLTLALCHAQGCNAIQQLGRHRQASPDSFAEECRCLGCRSSLAKHRSVISTIDVTTLHWTAVQAGKPLLTLMQATAACS